MYFWQKSHLTMIDLIISVIPIMIKSHYRCFSAW